MKQTTTAQTTAGVEPTKSDRQVFIVAALNLTWQMAVVVLGPILGGLALDRKFSTTPLLTIAGFVLSTFGVAAVLWHQLQLFGPPKATTKRQHS